MHFSEPGIESYLQRQPQLMRFITCGSVDDGKSTLLGRLLYDSDVVFDDQLSALSADSKRFGTQGEQLDFALLLDGLSAEREQGITIDIAFRFFTTPKRKFIIIDSPGHEQYTRNMATGASLADVAVVVVDASRGSRILTQTRRHAHIVALSGIRQIVFALNKMDLIGFEQAGFDRASQEYLKLAEEIGVSSVQCIPISALHGDNIVQQSMRTAWYNGPALLSYLEGVEVSRNSETAFRMPVQWVNRPNPQFRGLAGQILGGTIRRSQKLRIAPSGEEVQVDKIVTMRGDLDAGLAGESVTVVLDRDVDVARGDVLYDPTLPVASSDQFRATVLWMGREPLLAGRPYLLRLATGEANAIVTAIKYSINVDTREHLAAPTLQLNELGVCNLSLDKRIPFEPYVRSRELGGFCLVDRFSNETVGMGMISYALHRAENIHWQDLEVTRKVRAQQKHQDPAILWITGLSGAGKSTIASKLERALYEKGFHTYVLDGDNVRHGLNRDLGFTNADKVRKYSAPGRDCGLDGGCGSHCHSCVNLTVPE